MTPEVSVVVPLYNQRAYLKECLESIQAQSFTDFEAIVVDDGSEDGSADIAAEFVKTDKRFKLLRKEHTGVIETLNLGFSASAGKYLARMDSDDIMCAGRFQASLQVLQENGPGSIACGKVEYFSATVLGNGFSNYEKWLNSLSTPEDFSKGLFIECVAASPAWMCLREDFFKAGLFRPGIYPEDYDFCFRAAAAKLKFVPVNETVLKWRDHTLRSSRTLPQYADQRFWHLKAEYFKELAMKGTEREIFIWGAGRNGKRFLKSLLERGLTTSGLITNNINKIGSKILGAQVYDEENTGIWGDAFIAVCVSQQGAREIIRKKLEDSGRIELKDWIILC